VGAVLAVDLIWGSVVGSTGSIFFVVVDWPAHLATCAIALLVVAAVTERRISLRFGVAALIASVAIDLDHLPNYLGSQILTGSLPRPYTHSLLAIVLLLVLARALHGDRRQIALGLAFGLATHLFRDLATGPGVPLLWPISGSTSSIPYPFYAATLAVAAASLTVLARHGGRTQSRSRPNSVRVSPRRMTY
jgi:inner membrane protein